MNIGMLWFDNDPKAALAAKVERAAAYYRSKYGKTPTVCFVHPSMLPAGESEDPAGNPVPEPGFFAAGVEVRSNASVRPHHFWIGVNGVA